MINQIKQIVENYISNRKLAGLMIGTTTDDGVKVSEKLTIPYELIVGNLKINLPSGKTVRLLRDDGGQMYYILEVVA